MRIAKDRKVVGRKTQKSFCAQLAAISQVLTCHLCAWGPRVGVHRAVALIGHAKQAMGEGKSGPVETGITRLGGFCFWTRFENLVAKTMKN